MRYEQVIRIQLRPKFGTMPIDSITRNQLKEYFAELVASKKFGHGSLKNILATLRAVLSHALEAGIVESNPAVRLDRQLFRDTRKKQVEFLTRKEAAALLEVIASHRPHRFPFFLTALRTGMRLGELLALQWDDIQFGESENDPNRFILVRRNYTCGEFTTPKNHRSRRVDMSKELRRVLMDVRDKAMIAAFERGEETIPTLVFPNVAGGPLDGVNVYHRDFRPYVM